MARKLRTFITSSGFFDLAVAAPSMKAALEAWGTKTNIFQQGFAKEIDDPVVVAATMAKPGTVLRRAVGSDNVFEENAKLPRSLSISTKKKATKRQKTPPRRNLDDEAERRAAADFRREAARREQERHREQLALEKERKRRTASAAAAQSAHDKATRHHESKVDKLDKQRAEIDARLQAENSRWEKQRKELEKALRRAQDG
jgi:colicin import membrane protein